MRARFLAAVCLCTTSLIASSAAADGTVTLPLDRFERLLDRAEGTASDPVNQAAYGIVDHRLLAREIGPRLWVQVTLDVDVYEPGAVVPVAPSGDLALAGCRVDGQPAALLVTDGAVATRIAQPGRHRIELTIAPTGRVAAGASIALPLLRRPVTRLKVVNGREDLRLAIEPSISLDVVPDGLEGVLPPAASVVFRWEKRLEQDAPTARRVEALLRQVIEVREGGITGRVDLDLSIEGEPLAEVSIAVPDGLDGVRAQGDAVRAARHSEGKLRVQFAYPVTGRQRIELRYDLGDASTAAFRVPEFEVAGSRRTTGSLIVVADPEIEVVTSDLVRGYQPADIADLSDPDLPQGSVVHVFTFFEPGLEAGFAVRRHERVPVLASAGEHVRVRTVVTRDGKAVTTYALRVTNNDRQFLRLAVPDEADTWSAFVDGRAVRPARDDEGRLVVPVPKSRRVGGQPTSYPVELTWMWSVPTGSGVYGGLEFAVPTIDIVTTDIQWEVWVPERYRYFDFEGTVEPKADTAAPLTFDEDRWSQDDTGFGERKPKEKLARSLVLDTEKDLGARNRQAEQGFLPVRIGVPTAGYRLSFARPLAGAAEPLQVSMRFYDRAYIRAAEWLALLGLFVALLAVYAHLLLAIRNLRFVRGPKWFTAGVIGIGSFGVLQGLLPIAFPAWWAIALLTAGAGVAYWTVVFWAAIIGLTRSLWARFGGSLMAHARSVVSSGDAVDEGDEGEVHDV